MDSSSGKWSDEFSVIGDKGEIGFIDYEVDQSVCSYCPSEEGPVVISVPFAFVQGKPRSIFNGETVADSVTIKNTTGDPIELWAVKIYASNSEESFTLSLMEPPSSNPNEKLSGFMEYTCLEGRVLQPGDTLTIWVSCKLKDIGLHTSVVHFGVENDRIEQVIFLLAEDKISHSLASNMPYSRNGGKNHFPVEGYVGGARPTRKTNRVFKTRLPEYKIPKDIRELVKGKQIPDAIDSDRGLTRENYAFYFKTLLAMEEIQLEQDMRGHNMESVTMWKKGSQFLTLMVPGLAERRPSLVQGDYIFAKLVSG